MRAAADAVLRDHVRRQDRVAIYGLPGPGPAQPFTTAELAVARQPLATVRGGLVRQANGAVAEMSLTVAYVLLRGNDLVLARFTTITGDRTSAVAGSDLTGRFAEVPAVLGRLLRENAQSIVTLADVESRRFCAAPA